METKHNLPSTQRAEWRRKHWLRFFCEERVVELQETVLYSLLMLAAAYDYSQALVIRIKNFVFQHKKFFTKNWNYTIMILFVIILLIAFL